MSATAQHPLNRKLLQYEMLRASRSRGPITPDTSDHAVIWAPPVEVSSFARCGIARAVHLLRDVETPVVRDVAGALEEGAPGCRRDQGLRFESGVGSVSNDPRTKGAFSGSAATPPLPARDTRNRYLPGGNNVAGSSSRNA